MQDNSWQTDFSAMSLGWELVLPIFMGTVGGYFLDRWLGTRYVCVLGLMLVGVVAGFYNVWRSVQRIEARERRQRLAQQDDEA